MKTVTSTLLKIALALILFNVCSNQINSAITQFTKHAAAVTAAKK